MERRFCSWAINGLESGYEVIRYENGKVILVSQHPTREEAWTAAHGNRAMVLTDPLAVESYPPEYRTRGYHAALTRRFLDVFANYCFRR